MLDIKLTNEQIAFYKSLPEFEDSPKIDTTLTFEGVTLTAYGFNSTLADVLIEKGPKELTLRDIPGTVGFTGTAVLNMLRETAKLQEFNLYEFCAGRPILTSWDVNTRSECLTFGRIDDKGVSTFQVTPCTAGTCTVVLQNDGNELWRGNLLMRFPTSAFEICDAAKAIDRMRTASRKR